MKQLMHALSTLAQEFDCCILGVAHFNKKVELGDEFRMAGAQAWRESPRLSFVCGEGFVYVNKANDAPEFGVEYLQEVVRVLYEIPAETEAGGSVQVTARRARFGPVLLPKTKVLEQRDAARRASGDVPEGESPPNRLERMERIAADCLELLGGDVPTMAVWSAVEREYGHAPNGQEKAKIAKRLGVRSVRSERDGTLWVLRRVA